MDLPKLKPGHRFTLPRPTGSADSLLLARLGERDKAARQRTAIVTADATDAQLAAMDGTGIDRAGPVRLTIGENTVDAKLTERTAQGMFMIVGSGPPPYPLVAEPLAAGR